MRARWWQKPWWFARNVWLLRSDLWAMVRRKPAVSAPAPKGLQIRCLDCGHDLTKPCSNYKPCHVFRWPLESGPFKKGQLVYVRRTKADKQVTDIRDRPW